MTYPILGNYFPSTYQKYVPQAFDNSLDLYEQMTAVIAFLNQIVENFNSLSDSASTDITALTGLLTTLSDGLETFKEDLQNEVLPANLGAILEDWFESGRLATILTEELLDNKANQTELEQLTVNVKRYGAVGDGVTDDTSAIQSALSSLNGKAGTVLFPYSTGTYLISDTLLIDSNVELVGKGRTAVTLKMTTAKPMLENKYAGTLRLLDVSIRNLGFDGNDIATIGLSLTDASNLLLQDVFVTKVAGIGIRINTPVSFSGYLTFLNVRSTWNVTGLAIDGVNESNALLFLGGGFNRNTDTGVYIRAGISAAFTNVECSNNTVVGFKVGTLKTSFVSCYQEVNGLDYHLLPTCDSVVITGSRYTKNPPGNIRNEGKNVVMDIYGVPTKLDRYTNTNLIPNNGFKEWTNELFPPLVPFAPEDAFNELVKVKTDENHLKCTTTRDTQLVKLVLTPYLPYLKGESVLAGMYWKGNVNNSATNKRIRLVTDLGDLEYKSYNQSGALDRLTNEQTAMAKGVVPVAATSLELHIELSNNVGATGDEITISGFFLTLGNQLPGAGLGPISSLGGVMSKPLHLMDGAILKDSVSGAYYKLSVASGVLGIELL